MSEDKTQQEQATTATADSQPADNTEQTASQADQSIADILAAKEAECEELRARNLRLQADYDNLRRRSKQEKEELIGRAAECLIVQLLPVLDDFERALAADDAADAASVRQGVEMIYRALMNILEREGLKTIEDVGAAFDPHFHEAVARADGEGGTGSVVVTECYRRGYMLGDRVIRASMVKVGQMPADGEA